MESLSIKPKRLVIVDEGYNKYSFILANIFGLKIFYIHEIYR